MEFSEKTYRLIDLYLQGGLSNSELKSFEQEITQNSDLANEIQVQKSLNDAIMIGHIGKLLDKVDTDFDSKYEKTTKSPKTKTLLLSSLGISLVIGYVFLINSSNVSPQKNTPSLTIISDTLKEVTDINVNPNFTQVKSQDPGTAIEHNKIKLNTVKTPEVKELNTSNNLKEELISITTTSTSEGVNNDSAKVAAEKNITIDSTITEQKVIKIEENTDVIACPEGYQSISYEIKNPSLDKDDGQITINGAFNGLSQNVRYRIIDNDFFEDKLDFSDLSSGEYFIEAEDENGCKVTLNKAITLNKTGCSSNENSIFSTVYNQPWSMEIDNTRDATLIIKNASGRMFFQQEIYGNSDVSWDGFDENGNKASKGLYHYKLTYSDKEECIGVITLVK